MKRAEPKMTRAEREELRYRTVRNAYADPAVARKARGWSNERIERELGLRITKTIPALKMYDETVTSRKREELRRVQYAIETGFTAKRAREIRTRTDKTIRRERWREWCREEARIRAKREKDSTYKPTYEDGGFPVSIKDDAKRLNRSTTNHEGVLDEDARYGWAVQYWRYIEGWTSEQATARIAVDAYIGDMYKGPYKRHYQ